MSRPLFLRVILVVVLSGCSNSHFLSQSITTFAQGASGRSAEIVPAFYGLDYGLPQNANRLYPGAAVQEGTPVILSQADDTPVIFIPGMMGSRLFNTLDDQEREVWANLNYITSLFSYPHPLMVLELASDGITPAQNEPAYTTLHTKPGTAGLVTRLTGEAWGKNIDADMYDTIVQHFISKGLTENAGFWIYPYDWRKDIRTSAAGLDTLIQSILAQTGSHQVYLVAHSLGGLVTREYISDPARASNIRGAVIIGTPFLGTPKAFYVLQEGECMLQLPVIGYCLPKKSVIKALVPNYPALYQVMPSQTYFEIKGGGFYGLGRKVNVAATCPDCLSFEQTYTPSIANSLNAALAAGANQLHTRIDTQSHWNNVPVTIIAGLNQSTLIGIRQYTRRDWLGLVETLIREPVYTPAGDGTVAFLSVSLANDATGINLRGPATLRAFNSNHGDLVRKSEILQYIDSRIGLSGTPENSLSPSQNAEAVTPITSTQIVGYGVKAIHTYDEFGNHTGPAINHPGEIEQAIPGSAYFNQNDMSTVALIDGRPYTITIVPTGIGPVDISLVHSTITATLSSALYLGINVTDQSRITLAGDPSTSGTWQLDVTGTGTDLQDIAPATTIAPATAVDTIPPATTTITLEGTPGQGGWYTSPVTITLSASDNITGTGISRIEYAFSNDRQVRVYSDPIVVNPEEVGVLYAIAVDGMGNTQPTFSQAWISPQKIFFPIISK